MVLYGTTTIGWVWLLQKIDLGKIYPFMALSFVLVPLASHLLLGERFQAQYFIGVAIIILGIVISVRA
jgi:drug/metabolite transporter (DMT)-like permease